MLAVACAACSSGGGEEGVPRASRYGVFADLVLYQRGPAEGGPFFLDRFETTRQDWWRFLVETSPGAVSTPWGEGEPGAGTEYLPVARVTLRDARRFARWRFCRLPRRDEWEYAATGRAGYAYPWGDLFTPAWVNSAELGLATPTPVGTFESGRGDGGAYDLLGNVAEWTESVDGAHFASAATDAIRVMPLQTESLRRLERTAALLPWRIDGLPWPSYWWVEAWGLELPRLVVGGHFRSLLQRDDLVETAGRRDGLGPLWERGTLEKGDTVGIRLATDPADLMDALLRERRAPSAQEKAQLRAFLRRPTCRAVLLPLWGDGADAPARSGPLRALLQQELGS